VGRLDEAERALVELDRAVAARVDGGARAGRRGDRMRRLRTKEARRTRAGRARRTRRRDPRADGGSRKRSAGTEYARGASDAHGEERLLLLDEVEALLASKALVVDACRHVVRSAGTMISLATRPVLFSLARSAKRGPQT
jgi:hypothetical protein